MRDNYQRGSDSPRPASQPAEPRDNSAQRTHATPVSAPTFSWARRCATNSTRSQIVCAKSISEKTLSAPYLACYFCQGFSVILSERLPHHPRIDCFRLPPTPFVRSDPVSNIFLSYLFASLLKRSSGIQLRLLRPSHGAWFLLGSGGRIVL